MIRHTFVALGTFVVLAACSSSSNTSITPVGTADGGPKADAAAPATDAATESDSSVATPPSSGDCGDEASYLGCVQCCESAHPSGAVAFYKASAPCGCKPENNCDTVCADTICAATPIRGSAECSKCLNGILPACLNDLTAKCSPDAECVAFVGCFNAAGCKGKTQ